MEKTNKKDTLLIASWNKRSRIAMTGLQLLAVSLALFLASPASAKVSEETRQQVVETYGKLPLSFEANQGQTDKQVKFLSRGSGYTLFLTPTEAVLSLNKSIQKPEDQSGAKAIEKPAHPGPLR